MYACTGQMEIYKLTEHTLYMDVEKSLNQDHVTSCCILGMCNSNCQSTTSMTQQQWVTLVAKKKTVLFSLSWLSHNPFILCSKLLVSWVWNHLDATSSSLYPLRITCQPSHPWNASQRLQTRQRQRMQPFHQSPQHQVPQNQQLRSQTQVPWTRAPSKQDIRDQDRDCKKGGDRDSSRSTRDDSRIRVNRPGKHSSYTYPHSPLPHHSEFFFLSSFLYLPPPPDHNSPFLSQERQNCPQHLDPSSSTHNPLSPASGFPPAPSVSGPYQPGNSLPSVNDSASTKYQSPWMAFQTIPTQSQHLITWRYMAVTGLLKAKHILSPFSPNIP